MARQLGQDARLTFKVGPADPVLFGPGETFVTLDPAAKKPVFSVYAINYPRLDVKIYAVQPSDWPAFQTVPARLPAHRCDSCRSPAARCSTRPCRSKPPPIR